MLENDGIEWHVNQDSRTSAYWISRPYVSEATRAAAETAQVLLVPYENFRDVPGPLFTAGTADLFRLLKERLPSGSVEVCIDDDKYRELSLHGDVIFLGTILLKYIVAPVAAAILAEYIKRQLPLGLAKGEVRAHFLIENGNGDNKRTVRLDYEGPAANFELSMPAAIAEAQKQLGSPTNSLSGGTNQQFPSLPPSPEPSKRDRNVT